jgi:hypothetical protein
MKKIGRIVLAWWYWITNKNFVEAQERLIICSKCKYRIWFMCGQCGCHLQAKSRDLTEECPKGYWRKKTPGNYQQPGA